MLPILATAFTGAISFAVRGFFCWLMGCLSLVLLFQGSSPAAVWSGARADGDCFVDGQHVAILRGEGGSAAWRTRKVPISAGTHTIQWLYDRDGFSAATTSVALKNVSFTGFDSPVTPPGGLPPGAGAEYVHNLPTPATITPPDATAPASQQTSVRYIRGSDWGGGVGGILYSVRYNSSVLTPSYSHHNGRGDIVARTSSAAALRCRPSRTTSTDTRKATSGRTSTTRMADTTSTRDAKDH